MNNAFPDLYANRRAASPKPIPPGVRHPPNAFLLFARDERPIISARCPGMSAGEVTSILSHLWRSLDPVKKAAYRLEEERRSSVLALATELSHVESEQLPSPQVHPFVPPKMNFKSPAELLPGEFPSGASERKGMQLLGSMHSPWDLITPVVKLP
jgi:hypothetical protein